MALKESVKSYEARDLHGIRCGLATSSSVVMSQASCMIWFIVMPSPSMRPPGRSRVRGCVTAVRGALRFTETASSPVSRSARVLHLRK